MSTDNSWSINTKKKSLGMFIESNYTPVKKKMLAARDAFHRALICFLTIILKKCFN